MRTTPKLSGKTGKSYSAKIWKGAGSPMLRAGMKPVILLVCLLFTAAIATANIVEWDSVNGGGGNSTDSASRVLDTSINQMAIGSQSAPKSTDATPREWWMGYQQGVPTPPNASCDNPGGTSCDTSCYGANNTNETFTFTSDTSFHVGATQYYRYLWQTNTTYTTINSASKWSDSATLCGGACTKSTNPMTIDATSTSNTWYLILRAFNGGQADDDGWIGTTADGTGVQILGPYKVDITGPTIAGTVTPASTEYNSTHVDSTFNLSVTGISDSGCGNTAITCQYCNTIDGDCTGDWAAASYAAGTCTANSITCADGQLSVLLNMRAYDNNSNVTTASSITRICDGAGPAVSNIDAANTQYTTYVDGTFDVSGDLADNDASDSGVASCEYCKATDGICDTEWAAAGACTGATCTCTKTGVTCTNGQSLTLNIRGTDNVGNLGTGTSISRTCDTAGPTIGTVTPANTDYGTFVDSPFDLSATVVDSGSGAASCEYCKSTDGTCDTEWVAGTLAAGSCSTTGITCTNGQSLTLNIRATDNVGNVGTGTPVSRTCDTAGPTISAMTAENVEYNDLYVDGTYDISATANDNGGSGVASCEYYCTGGTGASCDGTWQAGTITPGPSGTCTFTGLTCSDDQALTLRIRATDNLGLVSAAYQEISRTCDAAAPIITQVLPTSDQTVTNTAVTSGDTTCNDGGAPESGLLASGAYDVQYCDDGTAKGDCTAAGTWVDGSVVGYSATNTDSFTGVRGNYYRFRGRCKDNVLNESAWTYSTGYIFVSSGGYIVVTENENPNVIGDGYYNTASNVERYDGVLNPISGEYEQIQITLYDENDNQLALAKSVTVTIENPGSSGAVISATDFAGATGVGTAQITGTMTGQGYVQITATAVQTDALVISASAPDLSGIGGRNQKANVLLRTPGGPAATNIGVETVDLGEVDPIAGGTVFNPVWSHDGWGAKYIAVAARMSGQTTWNIYVLEYSGGNWVGVGPDGGRVTSDAMCVQPNSGYSFSGDDMYIIFTGKTPCQASGSGISLDMYAVDTWGTDNGVTDLGLLESAGKMLSNGTGVTEVYRRWFDASWGEGAGGSCNGSSYSDRLLVTLMKKPPNAGDLELYMLSGVKNGAGLYTETDSTITQITDIGGRGSWSMMGSWSNDCDKIVFVNYTGIGGQGEIPYTGIYMIDLTQFTPGTPITSLDDAAITKVHDCQYAGSCNFGAALYPRFTADNSMISYMVDPTQSFDMYNLIVTGSTSGGNLANAFFNGVNFDNYVEYILDVPNVFTPQMIGESDNNEFGLVQCESSLSLCPLSPSGKEIFAYITQKTGSRDGALSFLELDNMSTITSNGGLLFYQGGVAAVIPPGAVVADEVKLQVTTPVLNPTTPDGKDIIVQVGEARDFYPDGIVFGKDIKLVFQYCDADNDGFLDTVQDATCTGGGGTIDENSLYVYYFCEDSSLVGGGCTADDMWVQLDGNVDPVNDLITVSTNHFSEYDIWARVRGRFAPQAFVQLNLAGLVTFPNPWRTGDGNVTFFANNASTYNQGNNIQIDIQIYDVRGSLVRTINTTHVNTIPQSIDAGAAGGLELATWDVKNNAGRQLASGIYIYKLRIFDGVFGKEYTGKLAVVR